MIPRKVPKKNKINNRITFRLRDTMPDAGKKTKQQTHFLPRGIE